MTRTCLALVLACLLTVPLGCRKKPEWSGSTVGQPDSRRPAPPVTEEVVKGSPPAPDVQSELVSLDVPQRYIPAQGHVTPDATGPLPAAVSAAKSKPSQTLEQLLDQATSRHGCNRVMGCSAEKGLLAIGEAAVQPIISRFKSMQRPTYQKFHLVRILGQIGHPSAIPFLAELLDHPHWNVRTNAALALAEMNAASELKKLKRLLRKTRKSRDFGFVYALAYAVQKVGGGGGKDVLLAALDPQRISRINWGYTKIAVDALAGLGFTEACGSLTPAILHNDIFLKKAGIEAAMALDCRQEKLMAAIEKQGSSQIPSVRRLTEKALKLLDN